jgi:hypothetical protein
MTLTLSTVFAIDIIRKEGGTTTRKYLVGRNMLACAEVLRSRGSRCGC